MPLVLTQEDDMNTEDIRVGGVYRLMQGNWTVERIENGKVRFVAVGAEASVGTVALDHFARMAESEVSPTPPVEISTATPTEGG
jgi:hypothetical protein